jgi:8-oxo-dGTP diphosphatase
MINVTCAIIRNEENEVLIVQRGEKTDHPYKWEFTGGKITGGESEEECIIREVAEELSIDIVICSRLMPVEYDYGYKQIKLFPFVCDTLDELPLLSEHLAFKWIPADDLLKADFSEADIPVAKQYIESFDSKNINKPEGETGKKESATDELELQSVINNMMSMQEAEWMAISAIENPAVFLKLLEYSHSDDRKLAFRASWTLTKVCDKFPEIIDPYLSEIVDALPGFDNEGVQRCFLRILSLSDLKKITDSQHGILADYCFTLLNSGFSAIAIKAYSMEILYRLALIYPELANELSTSIRILMEDGSAGILARGTIILKKLAEIPLKM